MYTFLRSANIHMIASSMAYWFSNQKVEHHFKKNLYINTFSQIDYSFEDLRMSTFYLWVDNKYTHKSCSKVYWKFDLLWLILNILIHTFYFHAHNNSIWHKIKPDYQKRNKNIWFDSECGFTCMIVVYVCGNICWRILAKRIESNINCRCRISEWSIKSYYDSKRIST